MPNHCANRLTVTGPAKDIKKFKERAQNGKNVLDIFKFYPSVKELEDIHHGACIINGKDVDSWREAKNEKGETVNVPISKKEQEHLFAKFGATNLYDYCRKTFGTKWGAYDSILIKNQKNKLVYFYYTAWSPLGSQVFERLKDLFPTLEFLVEYAERGMGFAGRMVNGADEELSLNDATVADLVEQSG